MVRRLLLSIVLILVIQIALVHLPTQPPAAVQSQDDQRCFEETGFCITGRLREFWEQNGGLPVFGLPIGPQEEMMIEGQPIQAQWFERNRLELHPENQPPYDVLLGRLGVDVLERQGRNWEEFPKDGEVGGCRSFPETQFNVCGEIFTAWQSSGLEIDGEPGKSFQENLALFGLPISPAQTEVIGDQTYTVQWFERARFELHPENEPPYNVLLGLLGREIQMPEEVAEQPQPPQEEQTPQPPDEGDEGNEGDEGEPAPSLPPLAENENRLLFETFRNGNWEIYMMILNGFEPLEVRNLTNNESDDEDPAWSPDGTRIAFTSEREGNKNIYVMNIDGSGLLRLTDDEDVDEDPAWSPDGTRIAFASQRDDETRIYTINPDGSDLTLVNEEETCEEPAWSPDGAKIACVAGSSGGDDIFAMNADGTEYTNLTRQGGDDRHPAWSPDGTRIAFISEREGYENLFVMNADGSDQSRRTSDDEEDAHVAWSPDSRFLVYSSERNDDNFELYVMTAEGEDRIRLTVEVEDDGHPAWLFGSQ